MGILPWHVSMLFMLRLASCRKARLPMEFYLCGIRTHASDQIPTWTDSSLKHGLEPGQPRGMDSRQYGHSPWGDGRMGGTQCSGGGVSSGAPAGEAGVVP